MKDGIYGSIMSSIETFENCSRKTGRTENIVRLFQKGDVVFLNNQAMVKYFIRRLKDYGKEDLIEQVRSCPPTFRGLEESMRFIGRIKGEIYFDHYWFYLFYKNEIESLNNALDNFCKVFSNIDSKDTPQNTF